MKKIVDLEVKDELVDIQSIGNYGEGVGKKNGFTIFVEGALPGETVKVQLFQKKKSYAKGKIETLVTPSKHRVLPICPLFEKCGGCQLLHLDYQEQLKVKQQKVQDALERIGKIKGIEVLPCTPSPSALSYRNKIQLPIKKVDGRLMIGLYAKGSHDLIEVDNCFIHSEIGQKVYTTVKNLIELSSIEPYDEQTGKGELRHLLIKSSTHFGQVLVILVSNLPPSKQLKEIANQILLNCPEVKGVIHNLNTSRGNKILGSSYEVLAGSSFIEEKLGDLKFNISAASFFQVNSKQAEVLYKTAIEKAHLSGNETVLDAYCGVGTLSLFFATKVKKVIGIECVPEAIENAKQNARLNAIENTTFFCDHAENYIKKIKEVDLVLINPPRTGCEYSFLENIKKLAPKKLIYISCDPATLARDLSILVPSLYEIECVQPFDMFPQTTHVETLVTLIKSDLKNPDYS